MNGTLELSPGGVRRSARGGAGGFTLIELLVTLTIAGILLGVAVPSFTSFIRSNRAQVQSTAIFSTLNYARAEAIRRATTVRVKQASSGWTAGWQVFVDANNNGSFDTGDIELRNSPALTGGATLTASATSVVFDRSGYLSGVSAPNTVTFDYRLGTGYCKLERDITINHLGRVLITRRSCS